MASAGIAVRPIRTAVGSSEFSEVFFDEVRVPIANRVGAENDGWRVAMVTFSFERGTAFVGELLEARHLVDEVVRAARQSGRWDDDGGLRRDVGRLVAELDTLWALTKWNVSEAARVGVPGVGGSVLKLRLCEAFQELAHIGVKALGRSALLVDGAGGPLVLERLRSLGLTIGGGTSQVQRNIIAERILGLPKEPAWTSS